MDAKLRIKLGDIEIEYEGSNSFISTELPDLLEKLASVHTTMSPAQTAHEESGSAGTPNRGDGTGTGLTTSTAAAKLGAKSGSDLALAAAAALSIGEGKESFTRSELLKAMQSAKAYYKKSFGNNLSKSLSTLVKSQALLDQGSEKYALQDAKRKDLQKTLAG